MNELLYVGMMILDFTFVVVLSRAGREWLYATIGANMILIGTTGAKLVEVFGVTTNVGNMFYASVFLALLILLETDGKAVAIRATWFGFTPLVMFTMLVQIAVALDAREQTYALDAALRTVFQFAPRILLASVFAYFVSTFTAIEISAFIKETWGAHRLWMRSAAAVIVGQAMDSVIFFSIAFLQVVPTAQFIQIMLSGYAIKAAAGLVGVPLLYVCRWYQVRAAPNGR